MPKATMITAIGPSSNRHVPGLANNPASRVGAASLGVRVAGRIARRAASSP